MRKEVYFLLIPLLLLASCEEIYRPDMETVSGQLVVDARITNEPSKNYVHLTRTRSFYDTQPVLEVTGATVSLIELGGTAIKGYESSTGYYSFNTLPIPGKQYYLRILLQNNTYESKAVTMPPIPKLNNFYTTHVISIVNENSGESTPRTYERPEREVDVDLPVTDALSHYRFDIRSLIEWTLEVVPPKQSVFPEAYGWYSYENKERFHLVGPKNLTEPGTITKHPLLKLSYDPFNSAHYDTLVVRGWIIFIDQYGTSKESYEYHEQLNNQFAATGSLFDPVQTQVYGNIICKSNPLEKVYGYFDLNSYSHSRYFLILNLPPVGITQRQLFKFPVIPDHGEIRAKDDDPIIKPDWWEE
jgi:hypothetical protein